MKPSAIGLFKKAVMEQASDRGPSKAGAWSGAASRRETFPFLTERLGARPTELPRQAALDRWRSAG